MFPVPTFYQAWPLNAADEDVNYHFVAASTLLSNIFLLYGIKYKGAGDSTVGSYGSILYAGTLPPSVQHTEFKCNVDVPTRTSVMLKTVK